MWQVEEVRDRERIRVFLEQDRLYAAYALGDLEPDLFPYCRWFLANDQGQERTLGLYFTALDPHAFFTMGEAAGLAAILSQAWSPPHPYFLIPPEHLETVTAFYDAEQIEEMVRMALRPSDFRPVHGPVVRLGPEHLAAVQRLYAHGNVYGFGDYQLRQGLFYGCFAGEELVAVAGTHLVSPHYRVAAMGNIFTHPAHRGRGYGTLCTSAVAEALLAQGLDVVLNVNAHNAVAHRLYLQLGFHDYRRFLQVLARR